MIRKKGIIFRHLDDAFSASVQGPPRPRSLRVSGLPYCPILDLVLPKPPEEADLEGACYTSIGTAMHSSIQTFLSLVPLGKYVWGGWRCPKCNREWKKYQLRPKPCCDTPLEYVEVAYRVGPMMGHSDMVCCYPRNKWVIFEFKTKGEQYLPSARAQHVLQIRNYCEMLRICFGIRVSAYVLVYFKRSKPKSYKVFGPFSNNKSTRKTADWLFRSVSGFKAATVAHRAVKDGTITNNVVAQVVKHRPCRCKEDYDDYMARAYENSVKTCPLLDHCARSDGKITSVVRELLEKSNENSNRSDKTSESRRGHARPRDRKEHVLRRQDKRKIRSTSRNENNEKRLADKNNNKAGRPARSRARSYD